jgi:hypothetical protein
MRSKKKRLQIISIIAHSILIVVLCSLTSNLFAELLLILSIGAIEGIQMNCINNLNDGVSGTPGKTDDNLS